MSSIDYFVGRPFKEITQGEEKWDWAIVLDGDTIIRNKSKKRTKAPDSAMLTGKVFLRPIFSELDTRLQFGVGENVTDEIVLTPADYTVTSQGVEEIYPQRPVELQELPPDPSEDRVVDQAEGEDEIMITEDEQTEEQSEDGEESQEEAQESEEA